MMQITQSFRSQQPRLPLQSRKTISFYSIPNLAHALPLLRIANYLKRHTIHDITFYSSQLLITKVQHQFPKIQTYGIKDQLTQEKLLKIVKERNVTQNYGGYFQDKWQNHFDSIRRQAEREDHESVLPDLIVTDFNTYPAIKFAIQNNIKLIINYPLSLSVVSRINNLPNFKDAVGLGGYTIFHPSTMFSNNNKPMIKHDQNLSKFDKKAIFLINSSFGLDPPMILPPNYIMTGPLINTNFNTTKSEIRSDQAVFEWIHHQKKKGRQDFVYVSFGSTFKLSQQFIEIVYKGLKRTNLPVIWSLKSYKAFLDQKVQKGQEVPDHFFLKDWIPQQLVLGMDEIKVFLTHGGWNSLNQSIYHGKPMVIIPSYPDQQLNAQMLDINKVAITLALTKNTTFLPIQHKIQVTSDDIRKSIRKILAQPTYKQNAIKLSKIAKITNGFEIAKQTIELSLFSGYQHLIDQDHIKSTKKSNADTLKIVALVVAVGVMYKQNVFQNIYKSIFK